MLGDHVTLEQGTGAVHTAPGHGQEDYVAGMQYGLPVYCPVDGSGRFYAAEGAEVEFPKRCWGRQSGREIQSSLKSFEKGALLGLKEIADSYPHCWRCHNATIFRATEQWFIGMENNNFRQNALEAIRKIQWKPAWGESRISNMVSGRPDG
jgi:isoleucyl-tRNA synthetase